MRDKGIRKKGRTIFLRHKMRKKFGLEILAILFVSLIVISSATTPIDSLLDAPIVSGSGDGSTLMVSCLGDSITNGYPYAGTEDTYPARLLALLESAYGPGSFEVINHGVNGYRADQVLADLQNLNWMTEDNPDFVLLMIGGNDLYQGQSIESTRAEVQQIVDLVTNHTNPDDSRPKIIVSAMIPNLIAGSGGSWYISLYNNSLAGNLAGVDLWITDNWDDFYDPDTGQANESLMSDNVHPNADGYAIMAENWFEAISEYLTGIYYVSTTGNDSNPGTIDQPWLTIQKAADTMVAGDTVWIREGIYNEQVFTVRSGNATDGYIVFVAYPGETPVIDGTGVTTGNTGFFVSHSYIKIIGIEICNWITGIWMANAGHVEISDCEVHHNFYGIGAADGTHDFELNRVEIHHFNLYGFDASPSGGADCYNGTFNDCIAHTGVDPEQNVDGFALGHGTQHDFVFNCCEIYDVYDGFDISARNTTLNRCSAHECLSGGYKIWQDNVMLINCLSYHNGIANVELDWDGEPGITTLQNCDFVDAQVYNIWVENSADSLRMYNCILAGGDNIGLAIEHLGVDNYGGDYNVFHNDNPDRAIVVWGHEPEFSLNQIAAGDWTAYSGQDQHSLVSFNPNGELFCNLSNWDFHLIEGGIAIDAGTSANAPSVDYDGVIRPQGNGYDIGTYEYYLEEPTVVWIDDDFNVSTPGWNITHFDKIQDGIDAVATNGTVYVSNGIYYENVVVDKTINLTGEHRKATAIDGSGRDVIYVSSDWVNILGFTIQNGSKGIYLTTDHCHIFNNMVCHNGYGVYLDHAYSNIIEGNIFRENG